MKREELTATELLAFKLPSDLYPREERGVKEVYRGLAKVWHPDVAQGDKDEAARVMSHITSLYTQALAQLKTGVWGYKKKEIVQLTGVKIMCTYNHAFDFELGRCLIGDTTVIYKLKPGMEKYMKNFLRNIRGFQFADKDMEEEFSRFLPKIDKVDEEAGVIILTKTYDVYRLQDVLDALGGTMDARNLAWVLSSLYNLACFLHYNKLAHNGITLDNVFISPQYHSAMLYGGWWYAVPQGSALLGMPKGVYDLLTPKAKTDKIAHYAADLMSIRKLGRDLAGGLMSGTSRPSDLPEPVYEWLLGGKIEDPFKEYGQWASVLTEAWGKRRFVNLDVDMDKHYSK